MLMTMTSNLTAFVIPVYVIYLAVSIFEGDSTSIILTVSEFDCDSCCEVWYPLDNWKDEKWGPSNKNKEIKTTINYKERKE